MPTEQQYRQIEVDDRYYAQCLRVFTPREKRIIEDSVIQEMGQEMWGFLTPGHRDYDPSVDYCVSLKGVDFLSSAAIGKLISLSRKHQVARGGKNLSLANIRPEVAEVFYMTRMDRCIFDIHSTVEDCLEARASS